MKNKKVLIFIGSRANYSSIKSVMNAINKSKNLKLQIVVGASALLEKYGNVSNLIEKDGFKIDAKIHMLIEGESPLTMAKSTGVGIIELSTQFQSLKPDIVLTVGDRFETMATTLAAAYMNIPIAHTMGGEITGTIDESIRHAVTKFSHIHFPASQDAKNRIIKLGEEKGNVHLVGCPRIDLVAEILKSKSNDYKKVLSTGVGSLIDVDKPFILVSQHPVTTEYSKSELQMMQTLIAIEKLNMQTIILWPNADAGSNDISKGIRKWREKNRFNNNLRFFKNLPIETYVNLMKKTSVLVGNSSSGIREGAFIGTPVVNIGTRQESRQRGKNVIDVDHDYNEILKAVRKQIKNGKHPRQDIYGDGKAGKKIAKILSKCDLKIQKKITY